MDSDAFSDALMWYQDGGREVDDDVKSIARYFWDYAVMEMEQKVLRALTDIRNKE